MDVGSHFNILRSCTWRRLCWDLQAVCFIQVSPTHNLYSYPHLILSLDSYVVLVKGRSNQFTNIFWFYRYNKEQAKQLSAPPPGSKDLHFPTRFPQNSWGQFRACLWKQYLSYWRSPSYNLMRLMFMFISALVLGLLYWNQGKKMYVLLLNLSYHFHK